MKSLFSFLILFILIATTGCGDSEQFVFTGGIAQPTTGVLRVQHPLARAIPGPVTTLDITGLDAQGQTVFGPVTVDKAAVVELSGVPVTVVDVRIEYMVDGVVVGRGVTPVVILPGQVTVVDDPDFELLAPSITELEIPSNITDQALLTANAVSASPPLSFLWTIAGVESFQEEDTQASSFTWTPAGLPGLYELLLEVTDSSGLTTLARRTLEVEGVHPWPSTGRTLQNSRRAPVDARANPLTNSPLTFDDTFIESQPAVAGDGTVYLGAVDTASDFQPMLKIIPPGPDPIESVNLPGVYTRSCPAILPDGTVVIGSYDFETNAYLNFVNPSTLEVTTFDLPGNAVEESCNVGADGTIYVASFFEEFEIDDSSAPVLNVLPPGANEVVSLPLAGTSTLSTPGIAPDGTVYVASQQADQAYLNVLSPEAETLEVVELEGEIADSSPAVGRDGRVFLASYDDESCYLNAYDPETGAVLSIPIQGEFADASPGLLADDTVVIVGTEEVDASYVHFIGPASASPDRVVTLGGSSSIVCAPALTADGTVYVGSFGGSGVDLSVVTPGSSTPSTVALSGDDVFSSPSIGGDGTVYISSNDFGSGQAFLNVLR